MYTETSDRGLKWISCQSSFLFTFQKFMNYPQFFDQSVCISLPLFLYPCTPTCSCFLLKYICICNKSEIILVGKGITSSKSLMHIYNDGSRNLRLRFQNKHLTFMFWGGKIMNRLYEINKSGVCLPLTPPDPPGSTWFHLWRPNQHASRSNQVCRWS